MKILDKTTGVDRTNYTANINIYYTKIHNRSDLI